MDQTVITYASEGMHTPKTWGRIAANKLIYVDSEASEDLLREGTRERNRVASVVASMVNDIRGEIDNPQKKTASQWADIMADNLENGASPNNKKQYKKNRETVLVHLKGYVKTMHKEVA